MKSARVGLLFLLVLTLALPVHAAWKDVESVPMGKNDLQEFKGMQIKVNSIDTDAESVELMFFNGNGDFQEKATLRVGNTFNFKDTHRIRFKDLTDEQFDPVILEIEQKLAIEMKSFEAPTEMEVGKSYELEVVVLNSGIESEKVMLEVEADDPYLEASSARSSKAAPLVDTSTSITITPLQRTESGAITVSILRESDDDYVEIESFRIEDIVIKDLSSGYIGDIVFPPEIIVGETYYNKARISITNDADVTSKFRIKFRSEGIHFDTDSKFGSDVLAEQLDPHTTKELLYLPEFTPVAEGEQEVVVELFSNGRIVDKEVLVLDVKTVGGASVPKEEPEEVVEEVQEEVVPQEEATEEDEVEEVVEAVEPQVTGEVVYETEEQESGSSWVALLAPFLLLAVVGKHFFLDRKKEE